MQLFKGLRKFNYKNKQLNLAVHVIRIFTWIIIGSAPVVDILIKVRFQFFIEFSLNYTIQDYRTQCYYEALENNYYWKYERQHLIFVYIHRIVMFYLFEHHLD